MTIFAQVLKCASNADKGKTEELESLIENTPIETVLSDIENHISNGTEIIQFIKYIFLACDCRKDWAVRTNAKVVTKCLKLLLQQNDLNSENYDQIMNKLFVNIRGNKVGPKQLIRICNMLMESIERPIGNTGRNSWQLLIPTVLYRFGQIDRIEYQDDLMGVDDYSVDAIQKLVALKWTASNIVSFAEMFLKIKLNLQQSNAVLMKFMKCLQWLDLDTIPPLVYHLLQLSSITGSTLLLLHLQQYFGKIYAAPTIVGSVYSESMNSDDINVDCIINKKQIECESNVLYHISKARDCKSVQKYLDYLKNSAKLYEVILHPFNFAMLLMIYAEHNFFDLLEVIKIGIVRYFLEDEMRKRCYFREIVPQRCDLIAVLEQMLDGFRSERSTVIKGMVKLVFVLLTAEMPLGREDLSQKLGKVAAFTLVRVVKARNDMILPVIHCLRDAMNYSKSSIIMDCFACVASKYKFFMLQNRSLLLQIYDHSSYDSHYKTNTLLEVMMSLVRYDPRIKEHVLAKLKSCLIGNKSNTHINLVVTHLQLLKHLKITSAALLSQSTNSQMSISTQISLSRSMNQSSICTFSNEAVCKEVIDDLKFVFRLHIDAKLHLYERIHDVVKQNPEITESIWDFFWESFVEYCYVPGKTPPINFENLCKQDGAEWEATNSVAQLVMVLGLLLIEMGEGDREMDPDLKSFTDLAEEMMNCDVEHFTLDQDVILTEGTPEAQTQVYMLHEAINTYDAFITYYILSWKLETQFNGQAIKRLFKAQRRLEEYLITYKKGKKKEGTQSRSNSTVSNTTQSGSGLKKLKPPNSIIPLHCLTRCAELLYSDSVTWADSASSTPLKALPSFHHHIIDAIISLAQKVRQMKHFLPGQQVYLTQQFESIEQVLFTYCAKKLVGLIEFDLTTAALAMEAFYNVISVKFHLIENIPLQTMIESKETVTDDIKQLKEYLEVFKSLVDEFAFSDDDRGRLSIAIVNTITVLADRLPILEKKYADMLIGWLKMTCREKTFPSKIAANNFIACLINTSIRFSGAILMLRLVASALVTVFGCIDSEASVDGAEMTMVNNTNCAVILQTVLQELRNHHDEISWIMRRIKLEYEYFLLLNVEATDTDHMKVKRKERNVCSKLTEIVSVLTSINSLAVPKQTGNLLEKIMQTNIMIFKLLGNLTSYFVSTSTANNVAFQAVSFDGLVRHTMKKLVPVVYQQIQSTEESSQSHVKSIPKVILAIESWKKTVLKLSSKTKIEVCGNMGIGVVRGFRVKGLEQLVGQPVEAQDESLFNENSISTMNDDSAEEEGDISVITKKRQKRN